jgi:DNA-directed RNA polymerase specialized sigma24 family protein
LRAGGATYREIAEALDCSTGTVGRLLHEHRERAGIPQPGRGRRNTTVPMVKKTA